MTIKKLSGFGAVLLMSVSMNCVYAKEALDAQAQEQLQTQTQEMLQTQTKAQEQLQSKTQEQSQTQTQIQSRLRSGSSSSAAMTRQRTARSSTSGSRR